CPSPSNRPNRPECAPSHAFQRSRVARHQGTPPPIRCAGEPFGVVRPLVEGISPKCARVHCDHSAWRGGGGGGGRPGGPAGGGAGGATGEGGNAGSGSLRFQPGPAPGGPAPPRAWGEGRNPAGGPPPPTGYAARGGGRGWRGSPPLGGADRGGARHSHGGMGC